MKISIVIPALNEEGIVGKTVKSVPLKQLNDMGFETEIIVVNNASTDNTAQEAEEAGARVIYESNRGYGNAYLRGFREAEGDIIVMNTSQNNVILLLMLFLIPVYLVLVVYLKDKVHSATYPLAVWMIGMAMILMKYSLLRL